MRFLVFNISVLLAITYVLGGFDRFLPGTDEGPSELPSLAQTLGLSRGEARLLDAGDDNAKSRAEEPEALLDLEEPAAIVKAGAEIDPKVEAERRMAAIEAAVRERFRAELDERNAKPQQAAEVTPVAGPEEEAVELSEEAKTETQLVAAAEPEIDELAASESLMPEQRPEEDMSTPSSTEADPSTEAAASPEISTKPEPQTTPNTHASMFLPVKDEAVKQRRAEIVGSEPRSEPAETVAPSDEPVAEPETEIAESEAAVTEEHPVPVSTDAINQRLAESEKSSVSPEERYQALMQLADQMDLFAARHLGQP